MPEIIENLSLEDKISLFDLYKENFPRSLWKKKSWADFILSNKNVLFYALKKDGAYIGFVIGKIIKSKVLIHTLLVSKKYQKNGYGKLLTVYLLERSFVLPEIRITFLHFRDSNKHFLLPFYKKIGFTNHKMIGQYKNGDMKHYLSLSRKRFNSLKKPD